MSAYPDFDGSGRETTRQQLRSEEVQVDATGKNGLHIARTKGDADDNESIVSWEDLPDQLEAPDTSTPLPVRPLGLSRRAGYTQFSDYE